jgi:multidrug efflux pump
VLPEIQRVPGVGQAQLFGTERAMRIWLDPAKLVGLRLATTDVTPPSRAERAGGGGHHRRPAGVDGQTISATVVVAGQLTTVEQFGKIVLRANADGSTVRLKDVARIELGRAELRHAARLNGRPSTGIGVQLSPTGNALADGHRHPRALDQLSRYFPAGVKATIPYDSSRFVSISITPGGGHAAGSGGCWCSW